MCQKCHSIIGGSHPQLGSFTFSFSCCRMRNPLKLTILNPPMFSDGDPLRFRGEVYHPYHFSCTGCKEELTATARFAFACFNLLTFLHDVYKCIFVNAFQLHCLFCFHLDLDCLHCLSEPPQGGADPPRLHGQRAERALLPALPRQDGNSHLRRLQVILVVGGEDLPSYSKSSDVRSRREW